MEKTTDKEKVKKKLSIAILIILGLLILVYFVGILFFTNHFYANTIINGEDYSYKTPRQAEELLKEIAENYTLTIRGRENLVDSIEAKEIQLSYVPEGEIFKIAKEQSSYLWLGSFFGNNEYDVPVNVVYEEKMLLEKVKNLVFFKTQNIQKPKDAYLSDYIEAEKAYRVIPEELGSAPIKEKIQAEIQNAILELQEEINLSDLECYEKPAITLEDKNLVKACEILNQYISTKVTYQLIEDVQTVDADLIQEWILVSDGKIMLDGELVRSYMNSLAKEHDTYGKKRVFQTVDGREKELPSGAFGWKIDRAAETDALMAHIEAGDTIEKEPLYAAEGAVKAKDDIGNTYVEIDLGSQHLYVVEEGNQIMESDFVSGNMIKGWATPEGVFGLTYKTRKAVLRGENYETPVNFWMPFNGNVGMHDATWRRSFGKDIFITNGSHGCVNLPVKFAKEIYEFVQKGMPVVCYY